MHVDLNHLLSTALPTSCHNTSFGTPVSHTHPTRSQSLATATQSALLPPAILPQLHAVRYYHSTRIVIPLLWKEMGKSYGGCGIGRLLATSSGDSLQTGQPFLTRPDVPFSTQRHVVMRLNLLLKLSSVPMRQIIIWDEALPSRMGRRCSTFVVITVVVNNAGWVDATSSSSSRMLGC